MSPPSHYETLKVARDAPLEVIRAAYRVLSQKHHPDKNNGTQTAHGVMAAINEAYRVLCDPVLRSAYDATLAQPAPSASTSPRPTPAPPPQAAQEPSQGTDWATTAQASHPDNPAARRSTSTPFPAFVVILVLGILTFHVVSSRQSSEVGTETQTPLSAPSTNLTQPPGSKVATPAIEAVFADVRTARATHPAWRSREGTSDSLWTTVDFAYNGSQYFVAHIEQRRLGVDERNLDCHACAPAIAALTYTLAEGRWHLADTSPNAAEVGTWGRAPPARVQFLELGVGPALTLEWTDMGQGYRMSGVALIVWEAGSWRYRGSLVTSADKRAKVLKYQRFRSLIGAMLAICRQGGRCRGRAVPGPARGEDRHRQRANLGHGVRGEVVGVQLQRRAVQRQGLPITHPVGNNRNTGRRPKKKGPVKGP